MHCALWGSKRLEMTAKSRYNYHISNRLHYSNNNTIHLLYCRGNEIPVWCIFDRGPHPSVSTHCCQYISSHYFALLPCMRCSFVIVCGQCAPVPCWSNPLFHYCLIRTLDTEVPTTSKFCWPNNLKCSHLCWGFPLLGCKISTWIPFPLLAVNLCNFLKMLFFNVLLSCFVSFHL